MHSGYWLEVGMPSSGFRGTGIGVALTHSIVECLRDDARTLDRAVMVAIAVSAPLKCKGGGTYGRVVVLVATVGAIIKSFKGTPKAWSGYWSSPAFRYGSGDITLLVD